MAGKHDVLDALKEKIVERLGYDDGLAADLVAIASKCVHVEQQTSWSPIETAPWDKRVLLWWRPAANDKYPMPPESASPLSNNRYAEACVTGSVSSPDQRNGFGQVPTKWWDGSKEQDIWHVTHWMPLPKAPWDKDAT